MGISIKIKKDLKIRKRFGQWVCVLSLSMGPSAFLDKAFAMSYTGPLGNRSAVVVTVEDDPSQGLVVQRYTDQAQEKFVWDQKNQDIVFERTRYPEEVRVSKVKRGTDGFVEALVWIRKAVHYTMAPRLDGWGLGLTDPSHLKKDLLPVLQVLNDELQDLGVHEASCQLFEKAPDSAMGGVSWTSSGGIWSNLGVWNDRSDFAWVREGYELILMDAPEFKMEQGFVRLGTTGQGMVGGGFYDLSSFDFNHKASSLLCAPKRETLLDAFYICSDETGYCDFSSNWFSAPEKP